MQVHFYLECLFFRTEDLRLKHSYNDASYLINLMGKDYCLLLPENFLADLFFNTPYLVDAKYIFITFKGYESREINPLVRACGTLEDCQAYAQGLAYMEWERQHSCVEANQKE